MASITKLKRETLAERAAEQLSEWMVARHFRPGDALPSQGDLAGQFGVSRTVVREALQELVGQGIVEVINGKGAIMRPLTNEPLLMYFQRSLRSKDQALVEIMEVRRALEVQAAALAPARRTQAQAEELRSIVAEMRECENDPEAYADLDLRLHLTIAEAARNGILSHLITSIRDATREAIVTGLRRQPTRAQRARIQAEHEAMAGAIAEGAVEQMVGLMETHFDLAIPVMSTAA